MLETRHGPRMEIAYRDSITKLHYDKSDTVWFLLYLKAELARWADWVTHHCLVQVETCWVGLSRFDPSDMFPFLIIFLLDHKILITQIANVCLEVKPYFALLSSL